eukprot:5606793-Prymnesium_polylepis.1
MASCSALILTRTVARLSRAARMARSKSGIQVSWSLKLPVLPNATPPGSPTGTLELKATKENAHSDHISSIAFNPVDGKTIVSGSADKTIKVWELRDSPVGERTI